MLEGFTVNYSVVIVDSSGATVDEVAGNCSSGVCSASFPFSENYCRISVSTSNVFGDSNSRFVNIGEKYVFVYFL